MQRQRGHSWILAARQLVDLKTIRQARFPECQRFMTESPDIDRRQQGPSDAWLGPGKLPSTQLMHSGRSYR